MTLLHPRLDRELGRQRIRELQGLSPEELAGRVEPLLPGHTFAPIGGREVTETEILDLRAAVVEAAAGCGFPGRSTTTERVTFDGRAGRLLHDRMYLTPHQAADEELWTHLTLGPLIDVAGWRFTDLSDEHLLGRGPRSTFRRLWWRAEMLGAYSWDEEHQLNEDETVQIMERPELVGNPALARALARGFLRRVAADVSVPRMALMRDALKRAYRLSPFLRWEALTAPQLGELIDRLFTEAALALLDPRTPSALATAAGDADDSGADYLATPLERHQPAADVGTGAAPRADGAIAATVSGSTFDDLPLARVGPLIRAAVAAHQEVDDEALVTCFEETHGVDVPPPRRHVFSKLAWSARARGLLQRDERTGVWTAGSGDGVVSQFGEWTFAELIRRAGELLAADPEPFDQLLHEIAGPERAPRIVASVVGTAINDARRSRRGARA
jgi:hypothetical protein